MNISRRMRRIAILLAGILSIGVVSLVGYMFIDYSPTVFVNYKTEPSGEFVRMAGACPNDHFLTTHVDFVTKEGIKLWVELCRPNRLQHTLNYLEIDKFERAALAELIRDSDTQWAVDQVNNITLYKLGVVLAWLLIGLLFIWAFTRVIGWIMQDRRG